MDGNGARAAIGAFLKEEHTLNWSSSMGPLQQESTKNVFSKKQAFHQIHVYRAYSSVTCGTSLVCMTITHRLGSNFVRIIVLLIRLHTSAVRRSPTSVLRANR